MKKIAILLTVSALTATSALCAEQQIAAANAMSEGSTYRFGAEVVYSPSGEHGLTVAFGQGSMPPAGPVKATVLVDEGVAGSAFKGDYIARAINKVSFGVTGSGYRADVALVVLTSSVGEKRRWNYAFRTQISTVAGTRVAVNVPLTVSGWTTPFTVANKDAAFAEDLRSVGSISVVLLPTNGGLAYYPAQSYTIDNVVLVNDSGISSPPGALSPLERNLIARFGYGYGSIGSLTEAMKRWDVDGDGMCDYAEIWAENDEEYANSIFAADDIQVAADGVNIEWTCVNGKSYTVLRAASLGDALVALPALSGIVATNTGYMTRKDTGAAGQTGPFYYRIRKD